MTTYQVARGRVAEGARLLDRVRPGWAREIDLAILEMKPTATRDAEGIVVASNRDIFGQLFGSWEAGYRALFPEARLGCEIAGEYGFDIAQNGDDWSELTAAWFAEIRARTGGAMP